MTALPSRFLLTLQMQKALLRVKGPCALQEPEQSAKQLLVQRFPAPRYVFCDQNTSQARFLLAKLNPSSSYSNSSGMSSEVILTDDVSLDVFTEHLRKLAVQS